MIRRVVAASLLLLLLIPAACADDQDPGLSPGTPAGPVTTSRPLLPCPPGGPDATTPAAGCLDADGTVVHE